MDLFYYGSQDIPLPFRRGESGPTRPRPGFCESCSAPVPAGDLKAGRATETYGLVLCAECREKARAEDRIELYFCDRCQVSVPVFRVDTGEALAGDGRILCLGCRMRATRRRRPLVALGVGLALLLAGVGALVAGRPGREPAAAAPLPAEVLDGILGGLGRELARIPRREEAAELSRRVREMVLALNEIKGERNAVLERLEEAKATLLDTRSLFARRMALLEGETDSIRREIDALMREVPAGR